MKKYNVGDSVRIKDGVKDSCSEHYDIGGWQGRITNIYKNVCFLCGNNKQYYEVNYDSITLRQMTPEYINLLIEDGYDFACDEFEKKEFTVVEPRDTLEETEKARKELNKKYDLI